MLGRMVHEVSEALQPENDDGLARSGHDSMSIPKYF